VHIIAILIIYTAVGRAAPFGDNLVIFFATGLVPFITFNYMSRFIMLSGLINAPLLAFPIVQILDIFIARMLLEILAACMMTTLLITILTLLGMNCMPRDIVQASYAYAASLLLGAGMGFLNGIIAKAFRGWMTGYVLILIVTYAASGIIFVPDALPEPYRNWLAVNPVLHAVEWMRSAYYDGYGSILLDKTYLLAWGLCTFFMGLILERLLRGKLLQG
jgi:capsular polysaccharide transport system permease protein